MNPDLGLSDEQAQQLAIDAVTKVTYGRPETDTQANTRKELGLSEGEIALATSQGLTDIQKDILFTDEALRDLLGLR